MTEQEGIERLVEGGFEREHAEYAVSLIVKEGLPLEGMVMLLITQGNPMLDSIAEYSERIGSLGEINGR